MRSNLDLSIALAKIDLDRAVAQLGDHAFSMARRLDNLGRKVTKGDLQLINELGELQGNGIEIDRLCAVVHERRVALERLEYAKKEESADAGS